MVAKGLDEGHKGRKTTRSQLGSGVNVRKGRNGPHMNAAGKAGERFFSPEGGGERPKTAHSNTGSKTWM